MSDSWMSESDDDLDEAGPADGGAGPAKPDERTDAANTTQPGVSILSY